MTRSSWVGETLAGSHWHEQIVQSRQMPSIGIENSDSTRYLHLVGVRGYWLWTVKVLILNRNTSVGSAITTYHRRRPVCIQSLFNFNRRSVLLSSSSSFGQSTAQQNKRRSWAALWSVVTGPVRCNTGRRRRRRRSAWRRRRLGPRRWRQ